ncbi:MAG: 30S ribosomal protein S17 [Dethiosulfovibrio peptidovorans]|nr:MAG: 30S ribosomal protein S17 [Dethiosulfovibrio peptidovorans]
MENRTPHRKTRVGIVVSDKMDKSISVQVIRHAMHPLYGKRIIKSKKFIAHDEENTCRMGDKVLIGEERPLSKTKRWSLVRIIERAPVLGGTAESKEEA